MKKSVENLDKKRAVGLGIGLVACLAVGFYSLPSYADYCKSPQAKCELNQERSISNIFKTLMQK